jgi:hypothetical protein
MVTRVRTRTKTIDDDVGGIINGVVQDGYSVRVPMMFMDHGSSDGVQRSIARARARIVSDARVVTDGLGGSRMHQPGFRYSTSVPTRRVVADARGGARDAYIRRLNDGWKMRDDGDDDDDDLNTAVQQHISALHALGVDLQGRLDNNGDDDDIDDAAGDVDEAKELTRKAAIRAQFKQDISTAWQRLNPLGPATPPTTFDPDLIELAEKLAPLLQLAPPVRRTYGPATAPVRAPTDSAIADARARAARVSDCNAAAYAERISSAWETKKTEAGATGAAKDDEKLLEKWRNGA